MRNFIPTYVLAVFFLATTVTLGQEKPFKTFEGGFSVQLPGEPWYETRRLGKSAIIQHQFHYESKDKKVGHMAAYHVDAGLVGLNEEQKLNVLISSRDAVQDLLKGEVLVDKPIKFAENPGREFKITVPKLKAEIRTRTYIVGDKFYQLVVVGPTEVVDSMDTDAFMNSFKLLDKKR